MEQDYKDEKEEYDEMPEDGRRYLYDTGTGKYIPVKD